MRPAEEKRCRCHRLQHTPSNAAKSTPWAVAPPCRLPRPRRRCRPRHRRRGHRRRGHRRRYQRRRDQRRRGRRLLLLLLLAIAAAASSRSSLLPAAAPPPPAAAAASSAALTAAPPPPAQPVAGGARTHGTLAHHTVLTCMSPHVLVGCVEVQWCSHSFENYGWQSRGQLQLVMVHGAVQWLHLVLRRCVDRERSLG